jgi:hypothetical protein
MPVRLAAYIALFKAIDNSFMATTKRKGERGQP